MDGYVIQNPLYRCTTVHRSVNSLIMSKLFYGKVSVGWMDKGVRCRFSMDIIIINAEVYIVVARLVLCRRQLIGYLFHVRFCWAGWAGVTVT